MKSLILFLSIVALLCIAGCKPDADFNAKSVQSPQTIVTLPDGRVLHCIEIHNPDDSLHTHFIYYFGTNDTHTLSINYNVSAGKVTYNQTVVLDGIDIPLSVTRKL